MYVVRVKGDKKDMLVDFFNEQDGMNAFIPRIEKWYSINGVKDYILKDLYPDLIFINTKLNDVVFYRKFKQFFVDFCMLSHDEKLLMEELFDSEYIIRHSVGNIMNSQLIVDEGPLMNHEDKVIKIDRHHRIAILNITFFNNAFKVPLEVIKKT